MTIFQRIQKSHECFYSWIRQKSNHHLSNLRFYFLQFLQFLQNFYSINRQYSARTEGQLGQTGQTSIDTLFTSHIIIFKLYNADIPSWKCFLISSAVQLHDVIKNQDPGWGRSTFKLTMYCLLFSSALSGFKHTASNVPLSCTTSNVWMPVSVLSLLNFHVEVSKKSACWYRRKTKS